MLLFTLNVFALDCETLTSCDACIAAASSSDCRFCFGPPRTYRDLGGKSHSANCVSGIVTIFVSCPSGYRTDTCGSTNAPTPRTSRPTPAPTTTTTMTTMAPLITTTGSSNGSPAIITTATIMNSGGSSTEPRITLPTEDTMSGNVPTQTPTPTTTPTGAATTTVTTNSSGLNQNMTLGATVEETSVVTTAENPLNIGVIGGIIAGVVCCLILCKIFYFDFFQYFMFFKPKQTAIIIIVIIVKKRTKKDSSAAVAVAATMSPPPPQSQASPTTPIAPMSNGAGGDGGVGVYKQIALRNSGFFADAQEEDYDHHILEEKKLQSIYSTVVDLNNNNNVQPAASAPVVYATAVELPKANQYQTVLPSDWSGQRFDGVNANAMPGSRLSGNYTSVTSYVNNVIYRFDFLIVFKRLFS